MHCAGMHNHQQADGAFSMRSKRQAFVRPACSSRLPNRDSIQPCPRRSGLAFVRASCRPNATSPDEQVQLIARICKLIEASETSPLLSRLATAAGLSQYYLQLFKGIVGMTPKDMRSPNAQAGA